MLRKLRGIIVLGSLSMILSTGCGNTEPETVSQSETPVAIQANTVQLSLVPITMTAVGTTEPYARATPGTRLLGQITAVPVSEGDKVQKGAVLARIESQDLLARRHRAESGVQAARTAMTSAEATIQRMRNLYRDRAIAKQKLDEAETGFAQAQAMLAEAEGGLREVEANLRYSTVTAPFTGVVTRKFVQPGDMASPGLPLVTMEQQHPIKVIVEVNEGELAYVKNQMDVLVEIESLQSRNPSTGAFIVAPSFEGKVDAVIPAADPKSRTFRVQVLVPNASGIIRSGMFARVGFPKDERSTLLIPTVAVVRYGQLQGVFEVDDGTARLRWVRLGKRFGDRIEVLAGLDQGTMIVVSDVDQLTDGQLVEVRNRG